MASSWVCSLLVLCLSYGTLHGLPVGDDGRAWERSGKFQGDIVFREGQDPRTGLIDTAYRWPQATLVYKIAPHLDDSQQGMLRRAFEEYEERTCIKTRAATNSDKDYVYIDSNQAGCWSYVGRLGGRQELNLGNGCWWHGTIVHELMHAIGFYHQQSATNRDDYVTIMWQNIMSGQEYNFDKYPDTMITDFGVQYDYGSIMHYAETAFSANGEPTIVPKDPNAFIGQNNGLSDKDIAKLELMYGCRK